jgi:lipoprotein-anchoring transpeptidase ErfK/SrfK
LAEQPQGPFAWILTPVQPSLTPAGEISAEGPVFQRYQLVYILATQHVGEQVWYQIGPDQWINQIYAGKVTPAAPPEGVAPGEKWIEVNLFEQTLAAYEGERLVYATLVSSGLPGWNTPTGLNRVWLKVNAGKMSGGYNRPDYYYLEDVPWTMYFNKDVALHTAYWHDGFGYKHSHGCVNLPPLDAQWLFQWAPDDVWVWVHES